MYPLNGAGRLGEGDVCPTIIELRSERGRGFSRPSLLTASLSEAGETGCLRNSAADMAVVVVIKDAEDEERQVGRDVEP